MKKPQPIPMPFPRGIFRNFSSQPLSSLTRRKASRMPLLVMRKPEMVRLCGGRRLAKRKSIGSTANCSAMSSNPTSTAHRVLTAPCPRMAPLAGLFVHTRAPV